MLLQDADVAFRLGGIAQNSLQNLTVNDFLLQLGSFLLGAKGLSYPLGISPPSLSLLVVRRNAVTALVSQTTSQHSR